MKAIFKGIGAIFTIICALVGLYTICYNATVLVCEYMFERTKIASKKTGTNVCNEEETD